MNSKIILVILIAAIAIVGIGIFAVLNSEESQKKGPEVDDTGKIVAKACEPYTVVDASGASYTFDHTLGPIAINWSYMGGAFFPLAAMVGEDLPSYLCAMDVSRTANSDFGFVIDQMPELKKLVDVYPGSAVDPSAIISSKPEVYIDYTASIPKNVTSGGLKEKLDAAGIPILYLDFQSEDPYIIANGIKMIGALFGLNKEAEELADLYTSKTVSLFSKAPSLIAANGGKRPLVFGEWGAPLSYVKTSWNNSVQWGALIYTLGGENMMPDGPTYPVLTLSEILSRNPDRMLISSQKSLGEECISIGGDYTVADTLSTVERLFAPDGREGYNGLKAWADEPKHVYVVNHNINRNIFGYAAVEFIAKMIWPEEYAELNPAKDFQSFWDDWLPFNLKGSWMVDYAEEKAKQTASQISITSKIIMVPNRP